MKLSAPIYHLKRRARLLSREERIPLYLALDRVAAQEGFATWGLLAAKFSRSGPAVGVFPRLNSGDLVLLGARPGQGKTLMALELAAEAVRCGNSAVVFSMEYTEKEVWDRLREVGVGPDELRGMLAVDCSDRINADYIEVTLAKAPRGTLAVVDYLQLLDQSRENPELEVQVRALKAFARSRGLILVLISQIARSYSPSEKPFPDAGDVRLPNPLDLNLFDKTCFINDGQVSFEVVN